MWVLALIATLIASAALYALSVRSIESQLATQFHAHLSAALDEAYFGDARGRVNDWVSIAYVGRQINNTTADWVKPHWFAAIKPELIQIVSIDGMRIGQPRGGPGSTVQIVRNGAPRVVVFSYRAVVQWSSFALLASGVAVALLAALSFLPTPLTPLQLQWRNELMNFYAADKARALVASRSDNELSLTSMQRRVFDLVHRPADENFSTAMQAANDARVHAFGKLDLRWFALGLSGNMETAWRLATHTDYVTVDLTSGQLYVRGRIVPMTKTPLFYYAWYALKRAVGDGWTVNPPSNRPDIEQGAELAKLMWRHKGHGKAIDELEAHGLRAKTLDQNRSKIKDELSAALGAELAEHYLFDAEKDGQGRLRYRLKTQPSQLQIIAVDAPHTEFKRHSA